MKGRKKKSDHEEPRIDPEEIARLHRLLEREERLEEDLRRDMKEAIKNRDKKLVREISKLENKNSRLLLWVMVILIMTIIIAFWVSRFNSLVRKPLETGSIKNFDINSVQVNLQDNVERVVKSIDEIKKQAQELNKTDATATAPIK